MSLRLLDRAISFQRCFVTLTGSVNAALMLSQAVYWHLRTNDPGGWFYKSQDEWEEETGLSRYEQEGAREKLRKLGFWNEKRDGMPAKLFFQINEELLQTQLDEIPQSSMRKSRTLERGKPADKSAGFPQSYKEHDITSEITTQRGSADSKESKGAVSTRTPKQSPAPDGILEPLPKGLEPLKQVIATACGFKKVSDWRASDELTTQALILNSQGITAEEIRETVDANPKKHFKLKFFAQDVLALRGAAERSESGGYVHKAQNACRAGGDCGGGGVLVVIGANGKPSASQCECYGMA